MRLVFFGIILLFLWAGTVSIKFPQPPSPITASPRNPCPDQDQGNRLMTFLELGTITGIYDNGKILTIGLSPQWEKLPPNTQQETYNTIVCYAQSQHQAFELLVAQEM